MWPSDNDRAVKSSLPSCLGLLLLLALSYMYVVSTRVVVTFDFDFAGSMKGEQETHHSSEECTRSDLRQLTLSQPASLFFLFSSLVTKYIVPSFRMIESQRFSHRRIRRQPASLLHGSCPPEQPRPHGWNSQARILTPKRKTLLFYANFVFYFLSLWWSEIYILFEGIKSQNGFGNSFKVRG